MNDKTPECESEAASNNLCKRGCGFYGNVQFNDMCSKCYKACSKSENSAQTQVNGTASTYTAENPNEGALLDDLSLIKKTPSIRNEPYSLKRKLPVSESSESLFSTSSSDSDKSTQSEPNRPSLNRTINRCLVCRKRVGLTGFQCRCEGLFCSLHRYADQHNCTFDYRKQGQDQIARDNPEVRCPKIRKI